MAKIFVLEDDPIRLQWLRARLVDHDVTFADSCTQSDRFVGPYDLVLLDHDLGGRQYEDHEDNGRAFAILVRDGITPETHVVIHSYNADGAMRIQDVVKTQTRRWDRAPFRGAFFCNLLDAVLADGRSSHDPELDK